MSNDQMTNAVTQLWTVWRVDDNGNVFVVREHLPQAEAQRLADEFEARGHKQMYWIEPDGACERSGKQIGTS